jgi:hypothetical protein
MHPWPNQDGISSGIVEGRPHRGAPTVVAGVARAVVLAFLFPFALILAFATVVGVGGKRGKGHLRGGGNL